MSLATIFEPQGSVRDGLVRDGLRAAVNAIPVAEPIVELFTAEALPTIVELMESPDWFADWFKGESWEGWKAFLCGVFALPMTPGRLALWRECTKRQQAPTVAADEAVQVVGRRGGKSRIAALTPRRAVPSCGTRRRFWNTRVSSPR